MRCSYILCLFTAHWFWSCVIGFAYVLLFVYIFICIFVLVCLNFCNIGQEHHFIHVNLDVNFRFLLLFEFAHPTSFSFGSASKFLPGIAHLIFAILFVILPVGNSLVSHAKIIQIVLINRYSHISIINIFVEIVIAESLVGSIFLRQQLIHRLVIFWQFSMYIMFVMFHLLWLGVDERMADVRHFLYEVLRTFSK